MIYITSVEEFQEQIQNTIQEQGVNVTLNPATRSISSITGDETTTSGASVTHKAIWGGPLWIRKLDKEGLWNDADGFIVTNGSVTLSKSDLITYAGSAFEVRTAEVRRWQGSGLYSYGVLYSKTGS